MLLKLDFFCQVIRVFHNLHDLAIEIKHRVIRRLDPYFTIVFTNTLESSSNKFAFIETQPKVAILVTLYISR